MARSMNAAPLEIRSVGWDRVDARNGFRSLPDPRCWSMMFVSAGRGLLRYRGTDWPVQGGDLFLIDRDQPMAGLATTARGWTLLFARFRWDDAWRPPAVFDALTNGLYRLPIAHPTTKQRVQDAFARLLHDASTRDYLRVTTLLRADRPDPEADAVSRRGDELIGGAIREILLVVEQGRSEPTRLDPRVAGAIARMAADPAGPHSVSSLAAQASVSASWLSHLFGRQLGMPPKRALHELRLREASLRLRETDDPIGTVAVDTGFGTIFYFSRQFRRHFGMSPREYRRRHRV